MNAFFIPNGPANLASLFPSLDFTKIRTYYLEIFDSVNTLIATTPLNNVVKLCEDDIVIHFVNSLGGVDALITKLTNSEHQTVSDLFTAPLKTPLIKSRHTSNRTNLTANNVHRVNVLIAEEDGDQLQELLDSPYAWIEWKQDYLPIVFLDSKQQIRKDLERYEYSIDIDFAMSNDKMLLWP